MNAESIALCYFAFVISHLTFFITAKGNCQSYGLMCNEK